jgi:heme a synthase
MHVESSPLARVRSLEISATTFRRLALASAVSLWVIVVSGATVRMTGSGLGCESWPGCEAGSFFPASGHHAYVEFGNRVVALFPLSLTLLAWLAAARARGVPRWVTWTAAAACLGTIAQAPLGFITIRFELHPLLVLAHFLLALVVLGAAAAVAVEAWGRDRGFSRAEAPGWARRAALVLVAACGVLVVTGTLATAAGPHSGGPDIRRFGLLTEAMHVHVRATAVFGILFVGALAYLVARRDRFPGLLLGALVLLGLLLVQMAVGEIQWRTRLPWGVVLVHVALAAAVWAVTVVLAVLFYRPLASLDGLARRWRLARAGG